MVSFVSLSFGHSSGLRSQESVFGSYFERFYVIIFLGKDQPQSEGSRHTDHGVISQVTAGACRS